MSVGARVTAVASREVSVVVRRGHSERLMDVALSAAAFTSSWSAVSIYGVNVVDWLLAAAAVLALCARIAQRRPLYISHWMLAPFVAALVVEATAIISGRSLSFNGVMVLRVLLATTVIAVLVQAFAIANPREKLVRLFGWWAAGIACSALAAALVAGGLISLQGILVQSTGERLSGLAAHPNGLAFSLTIAFPVVVYFIRTQRRGPALLWVVALGLDLGALFLSDSRSGLIVGAVSLSLAILLAINSPRARVLVAPVLLLAGTIAVTSLPTLLAGSRLITGAPQSDEARSLINSRALEQFLENPLLGGGFDALGGVAVPLQVVSTGGVALILGYYLFVLRPLAPLWRARGDALATTALLTLLMLLLFSFSNPVILERAAFWPGLIALFYVRRIADTLPPRTPWND
jgi:hypothetical protein